MRTLVPFIVASLVSPAFVHAQPVPLEEAAFTEYMANLLRKEVGESAVVVKGPLTLGLGELQANLDGSMPFRVERNSLIRRP